MKLGVNIDHIATLRQARLEGFPDPLEAAKEAIAGGADGIVCHLREDRRHIQDDDVWRLKSAVPRLDLEMAATDEMFRFALKVKPAMVTLVPEKRQELTTEGGLNVVAKMKTQRAKFRRLIEKLQDKEIAVSLFINPEIEQIEAAGATGAEFIELHTGQYVLEKINHAVAHAEFVGLRVNAGHGLDYNNVRPIARLAGIEELNIGFSIVARSVFVGLKQAVVEMKEAMR